ncbi:MAG: YceD family protein [Corynebacterium sp.]|uniref:YceD family protein n=1 Tax=Corynebacterium sp. TaxID=1720 RepID=UPI0026DDBDC0|nr:YceD family protein [Corynebacterium sp.]MDO5029317.1 YceD family protein [Corynebacterium sp.]
MTDSSPFILDVSTCLQDDMPEQFRKVGDAPVRVGAEMIGIAAGTEVVVDGIITNIGTGVMVDATVTAQATGECARCLAPLHPELSFHISAVFSNEEDFITGDDADEDEVDEEVGKIVDDTVDITQALIDEAGLKLPFNPTCETYGGTCEQSGSDVPEPDGISGEEERIDPRWAALAEKFGSLGEDKK